MRQALRLVVVLAVLTALLGGALFAAKRWIVAPGPMSAVTTVVIPKGTRVPEIGQLLQQAGVLDHPWLFLLASRLGDHHALLAGEYAFPAAASIDDVVTMMRKGAVVIHKVTIAEGLTVLQISAVLRQAEGLIGRVDPLPDEGSLLPETYYYSYGDERSDVVNRMTRAMNQTVDALWPKRLPNALPANKIDAIILASIVERETALPEERPHVAAVFLNRLKLHMRLQSDPTVIYALSNGAGVLEHALNHADLSANSPYNTYAVDGLPPGPICNPGKASLAAVLQPAVSDDLYFVADGTGGHVFARTLDEHNKNVTRLRRLEQGLETAPPAPRR